MGARRVDEAHISDPSLLLPLSILKSTSRTTRDIDDRGEDGDGLGAAGGEGGNGGCGDEDSSP